jgi:hypothetical protein
MVHEKIERVGKIDIAIRHLKEAIRLFFEERDLVVVHLVAAAASQILYDVGKKEGLTSLIRANHMLDAQKLKDHIFNVNTPYRFFKHADQDPNDKINITPLIEFTPEIIMDAVVMLQQINKNLPIEAKTYFYWFVSNRANELKTESGDTELDRMIEENISSWDFPTILSFLEFSAIVENSSTEKLINA